MQRHPAIIAVKESSEVFEARRVALSFARDFGWDEVLTGKVAIAATEIATNLVKHARGGGWLHISLCYRAAAVGLELLALDRGPGLSNIGASLQDGVSTTGTSGTGLGAIRRLSSEFDIYSQPGRGTALVSRFFSDAAPAPVDALLTIGVVQVPVHGEAVCGDSWGARIDGAKLIVLLADGLGHGAGAAKASQEAVGVLNRATHVKPVELLDTVHRALRATRGAAVAIASLDPAEGSLTFSGLGNISAMVVQGSSVQHLVSHNGTAGQAARHFQSFAYPWRSPGLLIMHSDGLTTSWKFDQYPGLTAKHPSVIAGVLYRDASRGRDDVCVVVVRGGSAP